jgi:hypothetical protein
VTVGELPSVTVVVDAEPTTRVSVPPSLSVPGAAPFDSGPVLDVVPAAKPDSAVGPASDADAQRDGQRADTPDVACVVHRSGPDGAMLPPDSRAEQCARGVVAGRGPVCGHVDVFFPRASGSATICGRVAMFAVATVRAARCPVMQGNPWTLTARPRAASQRWAGASPPPEPPSRGVGVPGSHWLPDPRLGPLPSGGRSTGRPCAVGATNRPWQRC